MAAAAKASAYLFMGMGMGIGMGMRIGNGINRDPFQGLHCSLDICNRKIQNGIDALCKLNDKLLSDSFLDQYQSH